MECTVAVKLADNVATDSTRSTISDDGDPKGITLGKPRVLSGLSRSMGVGSTRPEGLEPSTSGFGDLRSTN